MSSVIGQIQKNSGTALVSDSEGRQLYIDTKTLNFRIVDTKTGMEWNSIYNNEKSQDDDKSPIIIKYMGKDSTSYEWDAYKYSIQNNRYTINKIKNGVQIIFDFFETESYRLNEYMPSKISIKNYQTEFIDKLDQEVSKGKLSMVKAQKYKDALEMTYQEDRENNCYYMRFSGLPPLTLVKQLIELSKAVGYTTDMLVADSSQFGIQVAIAKPARFIVTMEATLEKGDLVVRIPTYEIKSGNGYYTMQNIQVLPSFGDASADEVNNGYILVPDGSGALFKLNTFNKRYPVYERPVYNNNYYSTLYDMPEFPEDLNMPVFGMYYENSKGKSKGYMGIIEKGAELGYIKVQLGTKDNSEGGTIYNKVCSTFDSMQYSRVKIFGPYSDNDARYLASTGLIDVDYTVRYKLFTGNVTYFDMAEEYRNYLIENNNLKVSYSASPKIFMDVIGTVTLENRFLGIPYKKLVSMTTYNELINIIKDLKDISSVIVNYKGAFNGGMNNSVFNKVATIAKNGNKNDLSNLIEYFNNGKNELFFDASLMRIIDTGGGFKPKTYALYGYDAKPIEFKKYNYATGMYNFQTSTQYLLNPLYLSDTVDNFIKNSKEYKNIFIEDMGSTYYANYNRRDIVNPIEAASIVDENLKKLVQNKTIALDNPNINRIGYARYSTNISRESSNYGTMYCSIPFRQLVMNGLTDYTTLDVNMSPDRSNYFLLQAFELGSIPKFTICSQNVDILKNSEYSDYFSMQYSMLKDKIKSLYNEYSQGFEKIGSREITDHKMLEKDVFETTYASGKSVIVNYNKFPVTTKEYHIDALGYMITARQ
ncbi:MAG: DUF5696 domain-containing protein [Clostridiales bacterium]|nr:DUF5696 domain-containing protein [Clostridiales bacterium]